VQGRANAAGNQGLQVAAYIVSHGPPAKALIMTGYPDSEIIKKIFSILSEFISKTIIVK